MSQAYDKYFIQLSKIKILELNIPVAICSYCTLGPHGEKRKVSLPGCKKLKKEQEFFRWMVTMGWRLFQA